VNCITMTFLPLMVQLWKNYKKHNAKKPFCHGIHSRTQTKVNLLIAIKKASRCKSGCLFVLCRRRSVLFLIFDCVEMREQAFADKNQDSSGFSSVLSSLQPLSCQHAASHGVITRRGGHVRLCSVQDHWA